MNAGQDEEQPGTGTAGSSRVLSPDRDRGVGFLQDNDYSFARRQLKVLVGVHEARKLATTLPLLFARLDGFWRLVGAMGFRGTGNCFVGPKGGWWGTHIPERLRFHPLWVTPVNEPPRLTLTAESPRVGFGGGNLLITDDGEQTELYDQYLALLVKQRDSMVQVNVIAQQLYDAGLLQALQENNLLAPADGNWFVANMGAIDKLDAAVLAGLSQSQALQLGFVADVSCTAVDQLRQMARAAQRGQGAAQAAPVEGLALDDGEDLTFNFDNL